MLCDAVISTSAEPPDILLSDPEYRRALLYHARDGPLEKVEDTPEVRRKVRILGIPTCKLLQRGGSRRASTLPSMKADRG